MKKELKISWKGSERAAFFNFLQGSFSGRIEGSLVRQSPESIMFIYLFSLFLLSKEGVQALPTRPSPKRGNTPLKKVHERSFRHTGSFAHRQGKAFAALHFRALSHPLTTRAYGKAAAPNLGLKSTSKGRRGEREVVRLAHAQNLDAERTWHLAQSPDATERACYVRTAGRPFQAKRSASGHRTLYEGLEHVAGLFIRSDGREWLVVLRAEDYLTLLSASRQDAQRGDEKL